MGEPVERCQANPTKGRSSVSTEQRENLEAILRQSAFPAGSDVNEQRRLLRELTSAQPLPAEVTVTAAALGGVPTAEITVGGIEPRHVVLYFHGGVYVLGDALRAADLASQVGRRTAPRSSPSTTGSPPSTRIRQRPTTLWPPTKPSCGPAQPLRTSPSRESPPAAASPTATLMTRSSSVGARSWGCDGPAHPDHHGPRGDSTDARNEPPGASGRQPCLGRRAKTPVRASPPRSARTLHLLGRVLANRCVKVFIPRQPPCRRVVHQG